MTYSPELTEKIKDAVKVSTVARRYTKLKLRNGEQWGISPFTSEKSPSFHTDREDKKWYCFATNQGGDVFKLLMEKEGYSFPEALGELAEMAGIPLTDFIDDTIPKKEKPYFEPKVIRATREQGKIYLVETPDLAKEYQLHGIDNVYSPKPENLQDQFETLMLRMSDTTIIGSDKMYLFILVGDPGWMYHTAQTLYKLSHKSFIKVWRDGKETPVVEYFHTHYNKDTVHALVESIQCPLLKEYNQKFVNQVQ